jgi:hypothetical protein
VCAWVVELELSCFYSGILFMALSRFWGYKLKDCGVFKGARFLVLPRLHLFICGCFSMVNSLGGKKIMSPLCFQRSNRILLPLCNKFLWNSTWFY